MTVRKLSTTIAMAIINSTSTANPALHIDTKNVNVRNLAEIIDHQLTAHFRELSSYFPNREAPQ